MAVHTLHRPRIPSARPRGAAEALREAGFGRRTGRILLRTARAFSDDNISRLGAALAFYTTIAIAPLMLVAIAVAGFFFDEQSARERVIGEIQSLAGSPAGEAIKTVQNPLVTTTGRAATVIGVITLVFGALGVFQHLQEALNSIWRVHPPPTKGWRGFLRQRLFSFATVVVTGFLLLVSLIASAAVSWLGAQTITRIGWPPLALQTAQNVISFAAVMLLFALIFKLLPDTKVHWRHVWLGAAVTALLFTVGKSLLGLYLGRANVAAGYGAARSLIVLLLWCYYAAQIVFLGAEFTRVTALSNGGRNFSPLNEAAERTRTVAVRPARPKQ